MRAIQILHRDFCSRYPDGTLTVLATGGIERDGSSRAMEAARQLVKKYGLPSNVVHAIESGGSTYGNALATAAYINALPAKVRDIHLVTNNYHMLRTWIFFSIALLRPDLTSGPKIAETDLIVLSNVLEQGFSSAHPDSVSECRRAAIDILSPYFARLQDRLTPVVVEDVLYMTRDVAARRYAVLLRFNACVREQLRRECKGVMDLLSGRYRF